jgi:4-amino-4-deoxy-L-arabinose transferase-like glycosyltransferase
VIVADHAPAPRARRVGRRTRFLAGAGLLLVLALTVRLGFVAATPDYRPGHDDRNYDWLAQGIARTGGYPKIEGADGPMSIAFRPPAYPYALAAVYAIGGEAMEDDRRRWEAARRVQAVLGTLTVALLGLIALHLWGPGRALLGMGLAAVYPPLVLVDGALVSEALFTPLVLAAVLTALHHRRSTHALRWAVGAGLLTGLATLTRSNAPVLLLPLALAVWTVRPRWSRAALTGPAALVAAAVLCVVPWTIRNAVATGEFIPLATQTGPALAGTFNSVSLADPQNPGAWRLLRHVPEYRDLYLRRKELSEPDLDRIMRARVRAYLVEHPEAVPRVGYWNLVRMLELGGLERARATAGTIGARPEHADAGVYAFFVVAVLALLGAVTPAARRAPVWLWLVPVLLVASVVFVNTETPRFRVPVDPFLLMLAALAVGAAGARPRGRATDSAQAL